ncbi:hypothetical protein CEY00_Acc04155 [Actinidia chinensis var. chinensis]|uniref:Uncharacterized protein n=1 Tax=Actinidia chinensis var. chinensis TaxID=1590841 RepID=A0A2R6RUR0_ACTCC|nr:hypothetical protein CEY00_Acc04155 [Actinidia chinensis var. chinensis]
MWACVSVHDDPDSAMKLRLSFGSKTDKLVIPSPVKDKPLVNGSKEDTFFDSQPWIESDCDDDFFSVCGDFTPSRGNTPVHQSFSAGTPRANRANFDDKANPSSKPELSPKKRLFELFRESLGGNQDFDNLILSDNQNGVTGKMEAKTTTILSLPPRHPDATTPFASGANSMCSSERMPNGDYRPAKEKQIKPVQCCLPRMLSCRGYSERKKMSSPSLSIG